MAEPLLAVRDLEVRYGPVAAVRGVSLDVGRGEVVGLIGPNGAGKTTTLSTIMGLRRPQRGDILFGGRSIVGVPTERIARSGISLVPEGRHIFAPLTVEENLRLGTRGRSSREGLEEDRDWIFSLFPIVAEFRRRPAGLLSGGQQQQLAIARALLARPSLLMLDEPSLGLAPNLVETVFAALDLIRRQQVTILIVEQRAGLTVAFADRTHVLASGELKLTLTPADAGDTARIEAAYFGA